MIPDLQTDGCLPIGIHLASEEELRLRFGLVRPRRTALMTTVSRWLSLSRAVGVTRFIVDGSFVTSKLDPDDVDCACWLPRDFEQQYEWGRREAVELYQTIAQGQPAELFPVLNSDDWNFYVSLFSRIRGQSSQKGFVEIKL